MTHETKNQNPASTHSTKGATHSTETRPNLPLNLGPVYMTPGVRALNPIEVMISLERHRLGDWGTLSAHDHQANNAALTDGGRILSSYLTADGTKFWIITEWDRSATTALLPDDY